MTVVGLWVDPDRPAAARRDGEDGRRDRRRRPLAARRGGRPHRGRPARPRAEQHARPHRGVRPSRALEASESKLRRFVADASHELRTPLAAVRAYAELFTRGAASRPDDLERSMKGISRESERMSVLVDDLLLLAHLDEGRPLELEPVALEDVVAEAIETARTLEPDRPLEADLTPSTVLGDHDRLRQVDRQPARERPRPHAARRPAARHPRPRRRTRAVLAVADSGPGMDDEHPRPRLRALLPRRPLARPRERRRRPRPRDRRRRRRGARRHRRGRVGARRGNDVPRAHPARVRRPALTGGSSAAPTVDARPLRKEPA